MGDLTPHNIFVMFLSIAVLLGTAHVLGELAQRFRQPAVLGELVAGVLLGPSVLGTLFPTVQVFLFPLEGANAFVLNALATIAVVLFLLVAGMEVDLSIIWKQGQTVMKVGVGSVILPFLIGFIFASFFPASLGNKGETSEILFSLFFATALSISALPVIARTLLDMNLYRTDLGMVVVSAAVFNDLIGWIMFSIIMALAGISSGGKTGVATAVLMSLAFVGVMLTAGKWAVNKVLPFIQAYTSWPKGVIGFSLVFALICSALTEKIGIHAIFGSFFAGVVIGDSPHLRESTRVIINQFISSIFAPLFFATIGLRVNVFMHFEFSLVLVVLLIACLGKIVGGTLGALWGKISFKESLAIGFAMNSRGAMEIILGLVALNAGLIDEPLFVALLTMAIVTSMLPGPAIKLILGVRPRHYLLDSLSSKMFVKNLKATSRRDAIHELSTTACQDVKLDRECVASAVWEREETLGTGLGNGVAVPHARLDGLDKTMVVVGISERGIDFDAPDGKPANVIFLLLTPMNDASTLLELTAEIARLFRKDSSLAERLASVNSFTEFYSLIKTASHELGVS